MARVLTRTARQELVQAIRARYAGESREAKSCILEEFAERAGYDQRANEGWSGAADPFAAVKCIFPVVSDLYTVTHTVRRVPLDRFSRPAKLRYCICSHRRRDGDAASVHPLVFRDRLRSGFVASATGSSLETFCGNDFRAIRVDSADGPWPCRRLPAPLERCRRWPWDAPESVLELEEIVLWHQRADSTPSAVCQRARSRE